MSRLAATLLFGIFIFNLPADAALQQIAPSSLPEGKGKDLVATACVGCHGLDVVVSRRATANDWRSTVNTMIDHGAQVSTGDAAVIIAYLAEHFGASAPAAPALAAASTLPDGPGKDVLVAKCFQCHAQTMWNDLRQDRRAWEGVLYRMVGRRALWTEAEINTMAEYLARVRGPMAK
jgi:cytochrome c5